MELLIGLLMKPLAIPLGCQKALHSHLTKSANYAN
jgi:hypothetical protein